MAARYYEDYFYDDDEEEEEEEEDWRLRPDWLHHDCVNPCMALDLGTCCKYPAEPLVRRAVAVADSVDMTLSKTGRGGCAAPAAELARLMGTVPSLLAQIHAVLPRAPMTVAAQLLCPVGRLAGALDEACMYGCPWACGDPEIPDRRDDLAPLGALLEECSAALRSSLGWPS